MLWARASPDAEEKPSFYGCTHQRHILSVTAERFHLRQVHSSLTSLSPHAHGPTISPGAYHRSIMGSVSGPDRPTVLASTNEKNRNRNSELVRAWAGWNTSSGFLGGPRLLTCLMPAYSKKKGDTILKALLHLDNEKLLHEILAQS